MPSIIENRIDRVAAGILENEAITGALDDDAADVFLKWALSHTEKIAHTTVDINDEEEADEAMYSRLKAIRRLAKSLARWQASDDPPTAIKKLMGYLVEIYGEDASLPSPEQMEEFVQEHQRTKPVMMIAALLDIVEPENAEVPEEKTEEKKKGGFFGGLFDKKKD